MIKEEDYLRALIAAIEVKALLFLQFTEEAYREDNDALDEAIKEVVIKMKSSGYRVPNIGKMFEDRLNINKKLVYQY